MLRIVENSSPGKAPCEQSISFACLILSYSRKTLQKASHSPPLQCPSFLRMTTSRSQKSEVWSQEWNRVRSLWRMRCKFRAEKRNVHAWIFFLPRSRKNGEISNIFLPKNKMFPLITWKEQAICLQKLQAVVITLSLLNFLEEYLIVKRTLTTLISLRCTGNVHA